MSEFVVDVRAHIEKALPDDRLHRQAWIFTAEAARRFAVGQEWRQDCLHASDLGGCTAETQARLRGELDLPVPMQTRLSRFDLGALYGAHMASLLKAAYEDGHNGASSMHDFVRTEREVEKDNILGHIDADIPMRDYLVEFKTTYFSQGLEPEEPLQHSLQYVYQAGWYALNRGYERFAVCVFNPALFARTDKVTQQRIEPNQFKQFEYASADVRELVVEQVARLQQAQGKKRCACDAVEDWRPRLCKWSRCPRKVKGVL